MTLKNVEITDFSVCCHDGWDVLVLSWNSDEGFGEYKIYKQRGSDTWLAQSETLDSDKDKSFIAELMKQFIEKLKVVE